MDQSTERITGSNSSERIVTPPTGGLERGGYDDASSPRTVLGPDGRRAEDAGEPRSGFGGLIERNPVATAWTSLGVGLAIGMIVGAVLARD